MSDSSKINQNGNGFRLTPPKSSPKLKLRRGVRTDAGDTQPIDTYTDEPKPVAPSKAFRLSPPRVTLALTKQDRLSAPKVKPKHRPFRAPNLAMEAEGVAITEREEVLSLRDSDIEFMPGETADVPVVGDDFVEVEGVEEVAEEAVDDKDILDECPVEEVELLEDIDREEELAPKHDESEEKGLVLGYISEPLVKGYSPEEWSGVIEHVVNEVEEFNGSEEKAAEAAARHDIDFEKLKSGEDKIRIGNERLVHASDLYKLAIAKDGFGMDEEDAKTFSLLWALQKLNNKWKGLSSIDPQRWDEYFDRVAYQWDAELPPRGDRHAISEKFVYHIAHGFKELAPLALMAYVTSYWIKFGYKWKRKSVKSSDIFNEVNEAIDVVVTKSRTAVSSILDGQFELAAESVLEIGKLSENLWTTLSASDEKQFTATRFNLPLFPMAAAALFRNAAVVAEKGHKRNWLQWVKGCLLWAMRQISTSDAVHQRNSHAFLLYISEIAKDVVEIEANLPTTFGQFGGPFGQSLFGHAIEVQSKKPKPDGGDDEGSPSTGGAAAPGQNSIPPPLTGAPVQGRPQHAIRPTSFSGFNNHYNGLRLYMTPSLGPYQLTR